MRNGLLALVLSLQVAVVAAAEPSIAVRKDDGAPQTFDAPALAALPQHTLRAEAHGKTVECSGPYLIDVLDKVGAPHGEALRGKQLDYVARVRAADDYRVVFSLAELDPAMHDAVPIVTASCNGAPLDAKDGPFRVIVPGEKRPARWIRQERN